MAIEEAVDTYQVPLTTLLALLEDAFELVDGARMGSSMVGLVPEVLGSDTLKVAREDCKSSGDVTKVALVVGVLELNALVVFPNQTKTTSFGFHGGRISAGLPDICHWTYGWNWLCTKLGET